MASQHSVASASPTSDGAGLIPNLKDRIPKLEPRRRRQETANIPPVPKTPTLGSSPVTSSWTFVTPKRRILSQKDHDLFLASPTSDLIKAWIFGLAESVVDTPCSAVNGNDASDTVTAILDILKEAESLLAKSPPDEQGGSRFGNKAFRRFLDLLSDRANAWHQTLGLEKQAAIDEAATYLVHSFGNRNRIDYGSGHELNFMMWLLCLYQLGLLQQSDFKAITLIVFSRYLVLMRSIQMTYYLEPAGSHGVWGLDDYQFLPFLFGASQLLHHPYITPRSIHQQLTIEEFGNDYLYLGQVAFVNDTKTVKGLRWHSPMLDDISSAKSWSKIDGGMRRMFVAEVLGKLPVMQHFLFGSLVPAVEGMSEDDRHVSNDGGHDDACTSESGQHTGHAHEVSGWGDCCGIKVPSSIAAAQELKKRSKGDTLRRIPFD
ncbi:Serine/threonine-protein phosphatase 2A activator 2 [Claviceps maximensis]|nr:Serine/threonine-protein phosphatase 2A activator 2 [Claviceps maximensis]